MALFLGGPVTLQNGPRTRKLWRIAKILPADFCQVAFHLRFQKSTCKVRVEKFIKNKLKILLLSYCFRKLQYLGGKEKFICLLVMLYSIINKKLSSLSVPVPIMRMYVLTARTSTIVTKLGKYLKIFQVTNLHLTIIKLTVRPDRQTYRKSKSTQGSEIT